MSLPENTTVLVVGAGPAGVTATLSLAHHGCHDFVMVVRGCRSRRTENIKSGHHTLCNRRASIDAVDGLLSQAIREKGFKITSRSSQIFEAKFDSLKKHSAHPYALYIPQNVTELVLGQKLQSLSVQVQRPHRVVGMKQNEKDSRVTDVSFEDGQVIRARYIIGADGACSIIRTIAGMGFSDSEGPNTAENALVQMVSADVTFEPEPVDPFTLEGYLSAHHEIDLSHRLCRTWKERRAPRAPSKEYIQKLIDTYGPACITSDPSLDPRPVKIDQLVWSTRHRSHSAIADRIFTRFPAGSQGMNLGMRDAIFLTEAITKHIQASAENPDGDDAILQEIADARHARALETIGFTRTLSNLASLAYDPYAWWMPFSVASFRDLVLRILGGFDCVQSKVAWGLSGLGRR
ncbi:hypothetical protein EV424DRAFT_1569288 [Suillus variegatus]|nr:hypothetical protein EV424DRAFT_1569288 [Suillus variegatus]